MSKKKDLCWEIHPWNLNPTPQCLIHAEFLLCILVYFFPTIKLLLFSEKVKQKMKVLVSIAAMLP